VVRFAYKDTKFAASGTSVTHNLALEQGKILHRAEKFALQLLA
jgi:hypothetical protein